MYIYKKCANVTYFIQNLIKLADYRWKSLSANQLPKLNSAGSHSNNVHCDAF